MKLPNPKRIKHRIMGSEHEHGIKARRKNGQTFFNVCDPTPINTNELVILSLPGELRGRFLGARAIQLNQAQIYVDSGNHPEYATAECRGPKEAALQETAGLGIMARTAIDYNNIHPDQEKISLHKTNRNCVWNDDSGISPICWGSHANYLSLRKISDGDRAEKCMGFLLSRWPLIGNGWFMIVDKKYLRFLFSQRGELMLAKIAGTTTEEKRPLINTRDEPHANHEIWRRIHDISGNSNMSQYQLYLKYGTFDIVLAMTEATNFLTAPPNIVNTGRLGLGIEEAHSDACHIFNADIRCQTKVGLADGKKWGSLDFQRYYFNEACRFFAEGRGTLTQERKEIMRFWKQILDALENWNLPYLARYLDWAAVLYYEVMPRLKRLKLDPELLFLKEPSIINPGPPQEGIPYDFLLERKGRQELLLDYLFYYLTSYANVDISASPYGYYLRNNMMEQLFSDEEINHAQSHPPSQTRAQLREYLMQNPPPNKQVREAVWNRMTFGTAGVYSATEEINLSNPYCRTLGKGGQKICPIGKSYLGDVGCD